MEFWQRKNFRRVESVLREIFCGFAFFNLENVAHVELISDRQINSPQMKSAASEIQSAVASFFEVPGGASVAALATRMVASERTIAVIREAGVLVFMVGNPESELISSFAA